MASNDLIRRKAAIEVVSRQLTRGEDRWLRFWGHHLPSLSGPVLAAVTAVATAVTAVAISMTEEPALAVGVLVATFAEWCLAGMIASQRSNHRKAINRMLSEVEGLEDQVLAGVQLDSETAFVYGLGGPPVDPDDEILRWELDERLLRRQLRRFGEKGADVAGAALLTNWASATEATAAIDLILSDPHLASAWERVLSRPGFDAYVEELACRRVNDDKKLGDSGYSDVYRNHDDLVAEFHRYDLRKAMPTMPLGYKVALVCGVAYDANRFSFLYRCGGVDLDRANLSLQKRSWLERRRETKRLIAAAEAGEGVEAAAANQVLRSDAPEDLRRLASEVIVEGKRTPDTARLLD